MKKRLKIISSFFLLLVLWLIIHPEWVVYEPEINGKVIDQNGNPIENAEVSRIEEKHKKIMNLVTLSLLSINQKQ